MIDMAGSKHGFLRGIVYCVRGIFVFYGNHVKNKGL